ncbi:MAG: peroxiredoxin [Chloroflexi bacterium]|nr:peroxiredoxin [Chloroflexota bacterium]MCC6894616.1 peroxiredoxin [Anaerolineae bacterium]
MPNVGEVAPDFELLNQEGQPVRLSDLRGKKVVIFAFPKANTGGCNAQACAFRDELPRIQSKNAVVFGVSTDSVETLKGWKQSKKLQYDLLSDPKHTFLDAWGAWGIPVLSLIKIPMTMRSYWVIDENGKLIDAQVGVAPTDSVDKAIKALEANTSVTV